MPDIPSYTNHSDGFLKAAGQSLAYNLLQAPIDSVNQIVKHTAGKDNLVDLHIVSAPVEQRANSSGELGQMVGNVVGALPYFVLLNRLGGSAVSRIVGVETAESLPVLAKMGGAAAAGFTYEALLRPVSARDESNFWQIKGANAVSSAITFATIEGIATSTNRLMDRHLPPIGDDQTVQAERILKRTMANALAGTLGAYVATDVNAGLAGKPITWENLHRNRNEYPMLTLGAVAINSTLGALTRRTAVWRTPA